MSLVSCCFKEKHFAIRLTELVYFLQQLKIEEPTKEKLTTKTFFDLKLCRSIVFNNPTVLHLMILKGVSGLPIGILHSMFTLIMIDHFHLTPDLNGYVLSYIGVVSMVSS